MRFQLLNITELGEFDYRWPSSTVEHFSRGLEGTILVDNRPVRVKHGIGKRVAYGRKRIHTVTCVNGTPRTEGVEADDYSVSRSLTSVLKPRTESLPKQTKTFLKATMRFGS